MNYRQSPPSTAGGYRPPHQKQPTHQHQPSPQGAFSPPPQYAEAELVTPQPTGKKAVVSMSIQVLVEVNDTGVYADIIEQAREDLARRVVEARSFLPLQMKSDRVYADVTVAELKTVLVIPPSTQWRR